MASASTSLSLSVQCNSNDLPLNVLSKQMPFEFGRFNETFADDQVPLQDDYALKDLKTLAAEDERPRQAISLLEAEKRAKSFLKAFLQEKAEKVKRGEPIDDTTDLRDDEVEIERLVPVVLVPPFFPELVTLELHSLIFKLWLRRIGQTREENHDKYSSLQDFELALNNAQKAIKRYRGFIYKEYYNEDNLKRASRDYTRSFEEALNKVLKEKQKSGFQMINEDLVFMQPKVRLCALLGLKLDFLDRLESIPADHLHHRSLGEWIIIFLQNNVRSVNSESKASLTIELLDSMGFDPLSTAVETILARSSKGNAQNHIEACEWAEIFIQDELKYNLIRSPEFVQFPLQSGLTNSWFRLPNSSFAAESGESNFDPCHVNIVNLVTNELQASSDIHCQLNGFLNDGSITLFHGTDHLSAVDILFQGIDLCAGKQKRDFSSGSGFYLTKNKDDALHWAQSTTAKPAILVFQVNQQYLGGAKTLNLKSNEDRWREILTSFRSGRRTAKTRESLRSYDLIEGPQATVKRDAISGELVLEKKPTSHQVCLISDDFAEDFRKTLHSILFLDVCSN